MASKRAPTFVINFFLKCYIYFFLKSKVEAS